MTDVRLDGAEGNRARLQAKVGEYSRQRLHLDDVADLGRRAVALDVGGTRRSDPCVLPGTGNGELLTDGVRCGDALALSVARAAEAADDGVDVVTVALRIGKALEQHDRGAFPHDEAVCAVVVGPCAGRRQRTDLAELDEAGDAHIGVDASGEDSVVVAVLEAFDGGIDCSKRRRTRRVDDEVRAVEVVEVGDTAGDDVAELTRHRVLGDVGKAPADAAVEFGDDGLADVRGKGQEAGRARQLVGILGEVGAHRGEVVHVARHGVAQDDRRAVGVEGTVRVAVVHQRLADAAIDHFWVRSIASLTFGGMGSRHSSGDQAASRTHPPMVE